MAGAVVTVRDMAQRWRDLPSVEIIAGEAMKIQPGYRRVRYAIVKHEMNSLAGYGVPDLNLTGRFYASFDLWMKQYTYIIDAHDEKVEKLAGKYGEEIFGLTSESKRHVYTDIIRPFLLRRIAELTGIRIN
jgi:hypothetical protein